MATFVGEALSFDDVMLVPHGSAVTSRGNVDLKMSLGNNISLSLPVIAAPMDTVCGADMVRSIGAHGGLGIMHRYMTVDDQIRPLKYSPWGGGAAISSTDFERAKKLVDAGVNTILVDTAHGHHYLSGEMVKHLKEEYPHIHIMAGNVATVEGFRFLENAGADSIRVGVGGGSMCSTRLVSGHGVPTLQSVKDIYEFGQQAGCVREAKIIADGGIRNTGDMVKAFAFGADAVMIGSMLAGTDEAPGESIGGKKVYRGMASHDAQMDWRGYSNIAEGVTTLIDEKGPAAKIFDNIKFGLGSGCSYSGCNRLDDLAMFSAYVRITNAGLEESRPHGLK